MLTYTVDKVVQPEIRQMVVVTLEVPDEWGMFTRAGDKAITKKASALITKLSDTKPYTDNIKHLLTFLRTYRSMSKSKSFAEASDTDVREQVWDFFKRACKCINIDRDEADKLWEKKEGYPVRA